MNDLVSKIKALEQELSTERGSFSLFALILRDESSDRWDLVVAAPWLSHEAIADLEFVAKRVQSTLPMNDLIRISRVVILPENDPIVGAFATTVNAEHGLFEFKDCMFSGLHVKHVYLFTSQRLLSPVGVGSR